MTPNQTSPPCGEGRTGSELLGGGVSREGGRGRPDPGEQPAPEELEESVLGRGDPNAEALGRELEPGGSGLALRVRLWIRGEEHGNEAAEGSQASTVACDHIPLVQREVPGAFVLVLLSGPVSRTLHRPGGRLGGAE